MSTQLVSKSNHIKGIYLYLFTVYVVSNHKHREKDLRYLSACCVNVSHLTFAPVCLLEMWCVMCATETEYPRVYKT